MSQTMIDTDRLDKTWDDVIVNTFSQYSLPSFSSE